VRFPVSTWDLLSRAGADYRQTRLRPRRTEAGLQSGWFSNLDHQTAGKIPGIPRFPRFIDGNLEDGSEPTSLPVEKGGQALCLIGLTIAFPRAPGASPPFQQTC